MRVRLDIVDLSACEGLIELPEDLRSLKEHIREITIVSHALETLPEWLGELDKLEVLRVQGAITHVGGHVDFAPATLNLQHVDSYKTSVFRLLPESLGNLTSLRTLDLQWNTTLETLPESLINLTALENLDLTGCCYLKVPSCVMGLCGLKDKFKELRLRTKRGGVAFLEFKNSSVNRE